jgi:hypothetical protein
VNLSSLRDPEVRKRSLAQRRKTGEMVAAFIEHRAAETGITLALSPRTVAEIFLITADGFAQAALVDPEAIGVYETFLELMIPVVMHVVDEPDP